ncbi:MAG: trypsin-like peptidase domain-containing protein [Oscillatoriales cyanobacterium C42_A2020_001]|nr:trypsin-like peptidase domain-containing protein [Leptolyngbyaceae cyanobacterium C42_A2020_001]
MNLLKCVLKQPLIYLVLLAGVGSAGCQGILERNPAGEQSVSAQPQQLERSPATPSLSLNPGSPDFVAQIVKDAAPAVVRINASRVVDQPFGDLGFDPFGGRAPQERVQRGTGSGFIVSANGRIFTNAHVVEGADNVSVVLQDGRRFNGRVRGADRTTDVAVVEIDASGLPTVKIGNSDSLLPGQAAIAIGNPLGLDFTVTQGIISATGRSGADFGGSARVNFIQTDTAINPGNSGGPLLNSKGEVVGINTAIIQGASGIGFAVPIATAQRVADQIVTKGRAEHPYLGVQMAELTPELREQINNSNSDVRIKQEQGVIVLAVLPNSPAAQGGIRPGDIIESVGGTAVETANQVQQKVETIAIGTPLPITVNRNGQSRTLNVKPAPLPDKEPG